MRASNLILKDMFIRAMTRHGTRPAVVSGNESLTYEELYGRASLLATSLNSRGIGGGDRIVFLLRNSVDYAVADVAVILAGACKVPLNDMLAPTDVGFMVEHSGASVVIAHTSFKNTIDQIQPCLSKLTARVAIADDGNHLEGFVGLDDFVTVLKHEVIGPAKTVQPSDPGLIIYTGGTTGKPKGVFHTQESLCVNFMSHLINAEIAPDEHILICSPLPHSAQQFMLAAFLRGARVTIEKAYDPGRVLDLIERERITLMFMVPTMIYRLLDHPDLIKKDFSSLRTILYGASPITSARLSQCLDVFGPIFIQIYGQTEIPNFVATLSKDDHLKPELLTSCGQPVVFCDVVIRDDSGRSLPSGSVGEITVRSFYTLECYHNAPDTTCGAYWGEYLRTGDIGYMLESGHIFLVDRAKDMIISGGMNVYSTEVENVIQNVPGVAQVVVIGLPDDDWGEAVTAFVIGSEEKPDPSEIKNFCRKSLAKYKVPKRVEIVNEIPLTPYGKPDKKALRSSYWSESERQIH